MNSLVATIRTAARLQPARALCAPAHSFSRAYSTPPSPADPSSSSSSSSSSSGPSESAESAHARLDGVIQQVKDAARERHHLRPSIRGSQNSAAFPRQSISSPFGRRPPNVSRGGPAYDAAQVDFGFMSSSPSPKSVSLRPSTPDEIWRLATPVQYSPPTTTNSARMLNKTLNENQVRQRLRQRERFERPSDKRVRTNSERHRRKFKIAVGRAVAAAMRYKDL
ncbi:ribosomal protein S21 [Rhodotorula toruloides]|uniref:Ribosomal protein S21 n=1 Tax=Rhodotorula toruloides TaxID=5286 RepID=A0A511K9G0_RHOTO|nr:ribosomal protein S21 [Rhodotorula toruloides]